ncbi:phage tail protein, partial [Enterobacter asburiae]|uniref:gp53-like domain-containing protein n=1 Tax=Scandinavium sp. UTDF21-P1B TaxID=3446379 RepID=UPI00348FCCA2
NLGLGELAKAGVSSGVLGANGYIAIPMIIGGVRRSLIIQWGSTATGSGGQTVTLPTAFPTLICGCAGSESGDLTSIKVVGVVPKTLSTIAVAGRIAGASTLANTLVKWIIVGY